MSSAIISNFWHFFFWGGHYPIKPAPVWYERGVWGNVVAVLPLFLLGVLGFLWHHLAIRRLHAEMIEHVTQHHDRLLGSLLEVLDGKDDCGVGELKTRLDDLMDVKTPGGLNDVVIIFTQKKDQFNGTNYGPQ